MERGVPKLIIEITEDLQRKIKHRIADDGGTIKDFVTTAIEERLKTDSRYDALIKRK